MNGRLTLDTRFLSISCWLTLFCLFAFSQGKAQSVSAVLSTNEILIGDQVKMELDISFPAGTMMELVDLSGLEKTTGIELLKVYPIDTVPAENGYLLHQSLIITSFDSGHYMLPQIPVTFLKNDQREIARTNNLLLIVNPYPISQDTVQLQPIKGIVAEAKTIEDYLPVLIGLAVVVLLGLIGYFIYKRRQNRNAAPPVFVKPPPFEVAMKKIEHLREAKLWQQNKIKEYQSELTFILREYLEDRFHIKALESTTDEIIADLRKIAVEDNWQAELSKILQTADLVKFAKAIPPVEVHAAGLDTLESFVLATKPKPVLETESDLADNTQDALD
ncbi:MAG: hypothetical protein R2828_12685 [Saprospiraceae bacterium]